MEREVFDQIKFSILKNEFVKISEKLKVGSYEKDC